ncbi:MSCRAMM family protein, partial [Ligilactobacillus ceti]|uniref:MSCRAMM family protein n=1 Tax=Ligilactobacillus ceti TaxID=395085 RepID=UPI0024560059
MEWIRLSNRYARQTEKDQSKIQEDRYQGCQRTSWGAVIKLWNLDENKVVKVDGHDTWTTVKGQTKEFSLEPGNYEFREVFAPTGYEKTSPVKFTITNDGKVKVNNQTQADKTVVMKDAKKSIRVKFKKNDIKHTDKYVEGARLEILDAHTKKRVKNYVWTTKKTNQEFSLEPGNYILHEISAPKGYKTTADVPFSIGTDGDVFVDHKRQHDKTVVISDARVEVDVRFRKTDLLDGKSTKQIKGARLQLVDAATNQVIKTWTTNGSAQQWKLEPGSYILKELSAPAGYEKAADIKFTITDDEKVIVNGKESKNKIIEMQDAYKKVQVNIKKTDEAGNLLKGAELKLVRIENGKEVGQAKTIKTNGKTAYVTDLRVGEYLLKETKAPADYEKAKSIKIVVNEDYTITIDGKKQAKGQTTVTMKDERKEYEVSFIKVKPNGKALAGAELQILKDNKKQDVVQTWTTTDSAKKFKLKSGKYILRETKVPAHWTKAADIKFEITKEGKLIIDGKEVKKKPFTIKMLDEKEKPWTDTGKVELRVSKNGEYPVTTTQLAGAHMSFWKTDKKGNKIKKIDSWTTSTKNQAHRIGQKLDNGYYVLQEDQAPTGYKKITPVRYFVFGSWLAKYNTTTQKWEQMKPENGKTADDFKEKVTDTTKVHDFEISKVDLGGKELPGAKITITGPNGFSKSWTSGETPKILKNLKPGKYKFHEEVAPEGYKKIVTDITFTIGVDGKAKDINFTPADKNDKSNVKATANGLEVTDDYKEHDVKVSKVDLGGKPLPGATIEVTGPNNFKAGWTSTKKVHELKGLKPGKYTFTETAAPAGYKIVTKFTFEVNVKGEIVNVDSKQAKLNKKGILVVTDDFKGHDIEISKVDLGGKELAGAEITITGDHGTNVSWTSGDKPHTLKGLKPGSYKFH